jgi:uncharacterized repeat protein (TIGR01451 family)
MRKYINPTIKLSILLLSCILFMNVAKAQYVTIPDTNFVNWLDTSGYAGCLNGNQLDTTCTAVLNDTIMDCYAVPIRDLTGIQYFKNLQILDCSNDSLYYIPSLPNGIVVLFCQHNNLSSLPPLPDSLETLYCFFNQLNILPALPQSLYFLDCSNNNLDSLPLLPTNLTSLNFSYNSVTNLPASLPASLNLLDLSFNHVANLPVSLPPSLITFNCNSNLISRLPALPTSITTLICGSNLLINLPALPPDLQDFGCPNNQLTVIPSLPGSLTYLYCAYNLLDSLPTLPDSLQFLACAYNSLSVLPALPNSMTYLDCGYNALTAIPSLPDSLYGFFCNNNPNLSCLPKIKRIVYFNMDSTAITCLPNYGTIDTLVSLTSSALPPLCDIMNPNSCNIYWNISGEVYYDANADCIFDSTDVGQGYVKMQLNSGGMQQQVYSSYGGGYSFMGADNINYAIQPDTTNLPFIISCPNAGYLSTTLTSADSFLSYGNNFALQCRTDGIDVGVHSIINNYIIPRPAIAFTLFTTAGDISELYGAHCAAGVSGQVQLVYTGEVTYHGVAFGGLAPTLVSGNTITWDIPDFGLVDDYTAFNTLFTIDTTAAAGTQVCFTVHVTTAATDYNPANNIGYFCFTIVDALDPNEKEVSPAGNIDTSQQWLTYTIRFQNTGSAPAQNIRITDTLDNNLDPSTFQLTAFSAKNLTQVFGNAVVFNFPNINLVDSVTSDSASRGYVQYKIKLNGGLQPGTQIQNTADIYFDLNPAVVTNTATSAIAYPTGINPVSQGDGSFNINLYPNPAKDYTILETDAAAIGATLQITDVTGREVMKLQISSIKTQIPVSTLAGGLYVVRLSDTKDRSGVKKLVIE